MIDPIDPRQALAMLREMGAVREVERAVVRVTGDDARDYLHRMTSQDLAALAPGGVTRTLVLTPQGRMVGAPWVWGLEDGLLLDLDPETADDVVARLERYVITEDVALARERSDATEFVGPRAAELMAWIRVDLPEAGTWTGTGGDHPAWRIARLDVGAVPRYRVLHVRQERPPRFIPPASWDALRVLERVAVWGRELTPDILPLEARLEGEAISFSKGCYPGQEPITMAKHRGHPPTLLVRARVDGGREGAALLHEGRKVGRLATVTDLTDAPEPNALAFVRYALAGDAPILEVEGGGKAAVLEGEGP